MAEAYPLKKVVAAKAVVHASALEAKKSAMTALLIVSHTPRPTP